MKRRLGWLIMGLGVRVLELGSSIIDLGARLAPVPTPRGLAQRVARRVDEMRRIDDWLLSPGNWGDYV